MKKISLLAAVLLVTVASVAQTTQSGTVVEYLGQKPKKAMSGVEIIAQGAGSTASDKSGAYTLRFNSAKDGDALNFLNTVWKNEQYELFIKDRVVGHAISSKVPLQIILVKSSFLKKQKEAETKRMTAKYVKERDQAIAVANEALKREKITQERHQITVDSIKNDYYQKMHDLDEFLDQFIHCDLSQLDEGTSRVLKLMDEGKIAEAKAAFGQLNIAEKNRQEAENRRQYQRMVEEGEKGIARSDSAQASMFENVKIYVNKLKLEGGKANFDEAARVLKEFALSDTTNIFAVWEYALFAYHQKDFADAEKFFLIYKNQCEERYNHNSDDYLRNTSSAYWNLGNLYDAIHSYAKAEECHIAALRKCEVLFNNTPTNLYRKELARIQCNLGVHYNYTEDYAKAEEYYMKALAHDEYLVSQDSAAYLPFLAIVQNNVGVLYKRLNLYSKSQEYLLKALANRKRLSVNNPEKYRSDLAVTETNLGVNYLILGNLVKGEEQLLAALSDYEILFEQNPDAFRDELATAQNNLGILFSYQGALAKAEEFYLKSMQNYVYLCNRNANTYRGGLARAYTSLGNLYYYMQSYSKAEEYTLKAYEQRKIQYDSNPDVFRADLASSLNNASALYRYMRSYAKAEEYYLKTLACYDTLFAQNPAAYRSDLAFVLCNIGMFYYECNTYPKAEEYLLKSLAHREILFEQDSVACRDDLATLQNNIGVMYFTMKNYDKAFEYYTKALAHREYMYSQNPEANRKNIVDVLRNVGSCYREKENYKKAEEYFLKENEHLEYLFKQNPGGYVNKIKGNYYSLMNLYLLMGEYDKCLLYMDKTLQILNSQAEKDPEGVKPVVYDIKSKLLQVRLMQNNNAETEKVIEELRSENPENYAKTVASTYNTVTYKKAKAGDYAGAIACIDKAIEMMPGEANLCDTKGEILLMKGDVDGALQMWRKVVELNPKFMEEVAAKGYSGLYNGLKERGVVE